MYDLVPFFFGIDYVIMLHIYELVETCTVEKLI
jgi:hypothetical protein